MWVGYTFEVSLLRGAMFIYFFRYVAQYVCGRVMFLPTSTMPFLSGEHGICSGIVNLAT